MSGISPKNFVDCLPKLGESHHILFACYVTRMGFLFQFNQQQLPQQLRSGRLFDFREVLLDLGFFAGLALLLEAQTDLVDFEVLL